VNAGQFIKGEKRAKQGRPKGSIAKTTAVLKDAILLAAGAVGDNGKRGLQGYLERVAREDQKAFCGLLGRVLPLTVAGDGDNPIVVTVRRLTDA
jgi:hypothetical protein